MAPPEQVSSLWHRAESKAQELVTQPGRTGRTVGHMWRAGKAKLKCGVEIEGQESQKGRQMQESKQHVYGPVAYNPDYHDRLPS